MASTGVELPNKAQYNAADDYKEKPQYGTGNEAYDNEATIGTYDDHGAVKTPYDSTHRQLRPRHIQLIGIGGTIGTALFVSIGHGLINGGPASLFLAFTIWYVEASLTKFCHPAQIEKRVDSHAKNMIGVLSSSPLQIVSVPLIPHPIGSIIIVS